MSRRKLQELYRLNLTQADSRRGRLDGGTTPPATHPGRQDRIQITNRDLGLASLQQYRQVGHDLRVTLIENPIGPRRPTFTPRPGLKQRTDTTAARGAEQGA